MSDVDDPVEARMLSAIAKQPKQDTSTQDPVEARMLSAISSPKAPDRAESSAPVKGQANPLYSVVDAAGGLGETVTNAALGTAGALGGGLAEVGGLLTGSTDRAQKWHDWAERNIATVGGRYDPTPQTETGKGIQGVISDVAGRVKDFAGKAGEATLRATGSPAAATLVDLGTTGAAQLAAGYAGAKLVGGGISGNPKEVGTALDQGRGAQPFTGPAQGMERQMIGGGAASVNSNPYPTLTGQQNVRGGDFPQVKLSQGAGDVSPQEQSVRSYIMNRIIGNEGQPGERLRPGPVAGNEDTMRTEVALAKAANPTPEGMLYRDMFANEQRALTQFSEGLIDRTGAMPNLLNDDMRGQLLNSALYGPESLRSFLAGAKNQIYNEARERQGGNPVELPSFERAINSPQLESTLQIAGLPTFLPGIRSLHEQFKTNGFENPVTGNPIAPGSVDAAMQLHKALNAAYTKDNAPYVGRLKKAIMDDVMQAGGADLYQRGNAIHAAEQNLFNAPGAKSVFGDVNPATGISEGLSPEKILPKINSLPLDQYRHIHNIFEDMAAGRVPGAPDLQLPPELQAAGAQARKEMAGALLRDIHEKGAGNAGVWNANAANKVMSAYTPKLNMVLDPDVLADIHTLNLGGQIMPGMHSYEGAFQQARRMDNAGLLERGLPRAGSIVGGTTAGLYSPGAAAAGYGLGGKIGEMAQAKLAARRQIQQAREADAQMEAAAKQGHKLNDVMRP